MMGTGVADIDNWEVDSDDDDDDEPKKGGTAASTSKGKGFFSYLQNITGSRSVRACG